jgi:hypothetical protein
VSLFFPPKKLFILFSLPLSDQNCSSGGMSSNCVKGRVGGGEAGKKAKTTPDVGEKSVSEKSQATRTCRNPLEKSKSKQTEFFVREVKDKRMTKNGPKFLIGWSDFPHERDDTREPISNLTGSEHMICEFQKQYTLDYEMKTADVLKQVTDRKKSVNEKNARTELDKTTDNIQETRDDNACDDAEKAVERQNPIIQSLDRVLTRGDKLFTGQPKENLDMMFTKLLIQEDLLNLGESAHFQDFMLEVSKDSYKGASRQTVRALLSLLSDLGHKEARVFVSRCLQGGT